MDAELLQDSALFARLYDACSDVRRKKLAALRLAADRRRGLAAAALLDAALQPRGQREREMTYLESRTGKLSFLELPDFFFSLSHAGRFAVCAVSDRPVGVDIEGPRAISNALTRRCFTPEELSCAPPLRLWVLKESYVKMTGAGLPALPETRLCFDGSVSVAGDSAVFWETALPGDYRLALCCAGNAPAAVALHAVNRSDLG